jgi:hypothetical protein
VRKEFLIIYELEGGKKARQRHVQIPGVPTLFSVYARAFAVFPPETRFPLLSLQKT